MGTAGESQMADVSTAFPAMPSAMGAPAAAVAKDSAVDKTASNSALSFGDEWGVFASGGASATTASPTAFAAPFNAFATQTSSQSPQPAAAAGGDLLSQTLGEFGLQ